MKNDKLHGINSAGFKTPEAYFETFEAKFQDCLNEEERIQGINKPGFNLPKDYFNTIEATVINRIGTDTPVIKLSSRKKGYYIVIGIAATIVLFLSLPKFNEAPMSFNDVETVAIENYIYEQDLTNTDLASIIESEDFLETDFIDYSINEAALYDYMDTDELELFIE